MINLKPDVRVLFSAGKLFKKILDGADFEKVR
jgi:hypothetical protein